MGSCDRCVKFEFNYVSLSAGMIAQLKLLSIYFTNIVEF
jgi:hypothetical protein